MLLFSLLLNAREDIVTCVVFVVSAMVAEVFIIPVVIVPVDGLVKVIKADIIVVVIIVCVIAIRAAVIIISIF